MVMGLQASHTYAILAASWRLLKAANSALASFGTMEDSLTQS